MAVVLVAMGLLVWLGLMVAVLRAGSTDQAAGAGVGSADAIVVLGAAQYDGRPSPVLKLRLDHAIALWKRQAAPRIIFTGGRGPGDTTSEAAVGRRYAERAGVPDTAVLAETQGRSTRESVAAVVTIARERGIKRVIVVSDASHVLRVAVLARQGGLEPVMSPARLGEIRRDWRQVVGESVKVAVAWVGRFGD